MNRPQPEVVVAGHVCLDIIPTIDAAPGGLASLVAPGRLTHVGPAKISLGGSAANTGAALYKLGIRPRVIGCIGDDQIGTLICHLLTQLHPSLAEGLNRTVNAHSSYTIVLETSGDDRSFLHSPGANEDFSPAAIAPSLSPAPGVLHFGYPPVMPLTYKDGGRSLADVFASAQSRETLVSLDMTMPDLRSGAGEVDWEAWHRHVLPHVDVFMPGFEETLAMLHRKEFQQLQTRHPSSNLAAHVGVERLCELCMQLIDCGAKVVVLKLGDQGLLMQTAKQVESLDAAWSQRQLFAPCFDVNTVGATGAGDCATAGMLAAIIERRAPEQAIRFAAAVGACNVLAADATSAIPHRDEVEPRAARWATKPIRVNGLDWPSDPNGVLRGPADSVAIGS